METIDLAYWNFLRSLTNVIIVCKVSPQTTDRTRTWICTSKKDFQSLTSFSSPGSANDPKRVTDRYSYPPPTRQSAELLDGPNQKCCDTRNAATLTRLWHERPSLWGTIKLETVTHGKGRSMNVCQLSSTVTTGLTLIVRRIWPNQYYC